uniref:Major facilitator superfamily (MFS) profile domain-containing protein n=1 Tax=Aegilops tauschii subsp. strangulata TaxID=200361 RepID=A0A453E4Y8_AEGTS
MAVGFAGSGGGEDQQRYGGRVTAFAALSCITAAMGGAIFGYDIGTAGGVSSMEPFLRDFFPDVHRRMQAGAGVGNYCKFDSQLLTLFTSSLYVSGLLTAVLVASWFTERHGRRPSMILGGVAYLGGAAVSGGAVNVYMAILGRALLGVGLGFANQGSATVPVRDGAGAIQGSLQQRFPIQPLSRRSRRHRRQLWRREDQGWLGLEALAGPGRRPRCAAHRRRHLLAGDAQQPRSARERPWRGEGAAPKDKRRRRRRRGAGRHRRRQRNGTGRRQRPAPHPVAAPVPPAACHGLPDTVLHAAHRDQRYRLLRAGAAAHHWHERECGTAVHHRHGHHLLHVHLRVHAPRRPLREADAPRPRRRPDVPLRGAHRRHHGREAPRRGPGQQGLRRRPNLPHRHLLHRLRLVLGPAQLADTE